jgi:hypothetical protein
MMEAAKTSETLVNFYQTTRRYNSEDNHLHPNTNFHQNSASALKKKNMLSNEHTRPSSPCVNGTLFVQRTHTDGAVGF